ncbi:endonuclease domain-containing protein [Prolixibacter sp. NT017]|uniref:endonuclease domain-containing protein n=1 Tax=Prolixibacter sp. NT017 TaxID=2652390 RepID=UPI001289CB10|nr:endonuclease domain-containing protein [Prolixibacter sp. NT017]GET27614.1 hypothetical protein NT017_39430 [Prolixibacter sp. NT017]
MVRLSDSREYEFYYGASPQIKARAAELRKEMTDAEKMLWQHLRNRKMKGLKFRRQHPVHIFILDFYCHERKLAIEVDGGVHKATEQKERDENRTYELEHIGISVLRFTNEEVEKHINEVLKRIEEAVS